MFFVVVCVLEFNLLLKSLSFSLLLEFTFPLFVVTIVPSWLFVAFIDVLFEVELEKSTIVSYKAIPIPVIKYSPNPIPKTAKNAFGIPNKSNGLQPL